MKKIITILILLIINNSTVAQPKPNAITKKPSLKEMAAIKKANVKRAANTKLQYFVIKADSLTYGYSVYANGLLYIEQKTIPAVGGTKGFADTTAAAKTAQLVIQKIKQGEMPPTITITDLKKINAL